jgi:hypothetical protein
VDNTSRGFLSHREQKNLPAGAGFADQQAGLEEVINAASEFLAACGMM